MSSTKRMPDIVETYELPTVLVTLPIHIFTILLTLVVLASILTTQHLHTRPQRLFAINCGFFLIASVYDLASDIGYLVIVDKEITVQTCSIVRNFVYNPIATQAFVDALERFAIVFLHYDMPILMVFTLYSIFPLICVALAVYNSFISQTLTQNDDVCEIIRRTQWTNIVLIVIQWSSAVIALLLYIAVWRKLKGESKTKVARESRIRLCDPIKMCSNRYYWDHNVVEIFFICCALPVIFSLPSLLFTILTEFEIHKNSVANVMGILILDLTTPVTLLIYIIYLVHIRRSLFECFSWFNPCCRSNERKTSLTTGETAHYLKGAHTLIYTSLMDYEAIYANFSGDFNFEISIDEYYLSDIYIYLPIHSLTLLYILIMLISIAKNAYMQQRPQRMFLISSSFFLLAAFYNFITDISYLAMLNRTMTVQECSIIRNFIQNPIAVQGFVEALDRYLIIFDHGMLHYITILILYAVFPTTSILTGVYNSFFTSDYVKDDVVCLITRRSAWTNNFLFTTQWLTTITAIILYFRIYRKVKRHVRKQHMSTNLTQERYYRDRSVVSLFFVCCAIPVILITPTITVTLTDAIFSARNKLVTLISWICLDLSIPFIWTAYFIYIPSIRQGVLDMFGLSTFKLFTPAPSSQSVISRQSIL